DCFRLHSPTLGWTTAVMRDRRDVLDLSNPEAHGIQCPDGRFPARTWTFDAYLHVLDTIVPRRRAGFFGSHLGRKRRTLAGAFEPAAACRGPAQGISLSIRNGDDRVVERSVDMGHGVEDLTTDLFPGFDRLLRHSDS